MIYTWATQSFTISFILLAQVADSLIQNNFPGIAVDIWCGAAQANVLLFLSGVRSVRRVGIDIAIILLLLILWT